MVRYDRKRNGAEQDAYRRKTGIIYRRWIPAVQKIYQRMWQIREIRVYCKPKSKRKRICKVDQQSIKKGVAYEQNRQNAYSTQSVF